MLNKQQIIGKYHRRKPLNTRQQIQNPKYHRSSKHGPKEKRVHASSSLSFDLKSLKGEKQDRFQRSDKQRKQTFGFLNQPNISLIAQKQEGSSFMSEQHGDGSLDSMDRMIIGVTGLQLQGDYNNQNRQQDRTTIILKQKSKSRLQHNKSHQQLNYSRLRQEYEKLIGRKRLFGDQDQEPQEWSLPNENLNIQGQLIPRQNNILNQENQQFEVEQQDPKYDQISNKIQQQFVHFRHQVSNLKSNEDTLKLHHKIQEAFRQFRKLLNKKQNNSTSNLLNSVSLSFLQGHDQSNNSIRLLTGNLSEIHQQRELHAGSQKDKSQNDRMQIEEQLRGFVDHGQTIIQENNILKNQNEPQGQQNDYAEFFENPSLQALANKSSKENYNQDSIQIIQNLQKQLAGNHSNYQTQQGYQQNQALKQNRVAQYRQLHKHILFKYSSNSLSKIHFNQNNSITNNISQPGIDTSPTLNNQMPVLTQSISKKSQQQQYQYILQQLNDPQAPKQTKNQDIHKFALIFQQREEWIQSQNNKNKSQKWKRSQYALLKKFKEMIVNPCVSWDQQELEQK